MLLHDLQAARLDVFDNWIDVSAGGDWVESPPAAKSTATGAMSAAKPTDDFRRSVATNGAPRKAPYEQPEEYVTKLSRHCHGTAMGFRGSPSHADTSPQVNDLDALPVTLADTSDQLPKPRSVPFFSDSTL